MRLGQCKVLFGVAALAVALAFAAPANAQNKCAAGKLKCVAKKQACKLGCHAKDEGKNDPVALAACLTKCEDKFDGGAIPSKGCFAKLETKPPCLTTGDTAAQEAKADAFVLDVVQELDPGYPPSTINKCSAGKKKCVAKKASCKLGCESKHVAKPDLVKRAACLSKCEDKFDGGVDPLKGCFAKLETKPPCLTVGDTAALEAKVDAFVIDVTGELTPPLMGGCGNGLNDVGEACDASAPPAGWAVCGPDFTCVACNCACPTKVHFAGDNTDPATILDTGWTGIAHRAPVISNGDVTVNISACSAAPDRPCGTCSVSGPVANNVAAGELRNQRCSGDLSAECSSAPNGAGCALGLCQFYFGAPLPLVAGGVGTCVVNQFNGSVSGTANVESGQAVTNALLTSRVHSAVISTDTPCPVCVGDPIKNDNVNGGSCNGGPRNGLSCDGNGTVFNRPDFGTTSFDCPPPAGTIAVLPIDLSNTTGTIAKAITAGSPNCSAGGLPAGTKCACDTCNNLNAEPCDANGDCPISGGNPGICGGRRCIGGTNAGAPCTVASQCSGGGSCARPGEPTKPNGCVDDTTQPANGSLCVDTFPTGDNEGECPEGPPTGICSLASGHQQRSCSSANDCCDDAPACVTDPVTPGECLVSNRLCFLDNGLGGSIIATGMADPPTQDTSDPTLAAIFCIGPTSAPAVNIAAGLPGPGRATISGTATGHP